MKSFMAFTSVDFLHKLGFGGYSNGSLLLFWEINPCDFPQFRYCIGGFSVFLVVAQHSKIELTGNSMSTCKQMV
ncbi:hypothetical protein ES319_D13G218600v1 [Gossypium barbadense]|uniref:Uncharacterized protein n=1 Tax=Gossypium barbadense TaxID=3634 RepID=A0A5J5NU02_GOSBA|nr:hypothetical protein ES319_D13G218600v1 [Gossypium barbadense]